MNIKNKEDVLCEVCNIRLPNVQTQMAHVLGKKHQLALHREHMAEEKEKCGVFVSGFPNLLKHEEILERLSTFGKIIDHYFEQDNRFAIIQFDNPEPVERLLNTEVIVRGRMLAIKRRVMRDKGPGHNGPVQPQEDFDVINENLKNYEDFQSQAVCLIRQLQPNWIEAVEKYRHLCRDLQNILRDTFPGCIVHPFGSTVTGLGFKTSDVDIFVQVTNVAGPATSSDREYSHAQQCVNKSRKLLHRYGRVFSNVRAIPRAKTPIVKCIHNATKISCDFNFKNMLGVYNSKLIQYYLSLDLKLKIIVIVLKYWAKVHELSGSSGRFSNYCIITLFIFYLQHSPYSLPSVLSLQESQDCQNPQDGWNGDFVPATNFSSEALTSHSIPEILRGFFEFYSAFDYTLNIVCPYLGHVVPKTDFLKPELLPDTFERYKNNVNNKQALRLETAICVQDPFEHIHNIAGSVASKSLEEFVMLCKLGTEIFKSQPVESMALYRLFTEEGDNIDFKKYSGNEKECKFRIPMGNHLVYLNNKLFEKEEELSSNVDERTTYLRKEWYSLVNKFIIIVLKDVLKLNVSVEKDSPDPKAQRLNGQNDVHDTCIVDTVTFSCSGFYNLWEARRAISKDFKVYEDLPILEKQITMTNYIYDVLCKGYTPKEPLIEFRISIHAKTNPTEMTIHINKVNSKKGCFQPFGIFLAKNVPNWFEKYITELDKSVQKEKTASELSENNVNNEIKDAVKVEGKEETKQIDAV